jgi:hypothetical protein
MYHENDSAKYQESWHENKVITGLVGFFLVLLIGMSVLCCI